MWLEGERQARAKRASRRQASQVAGAEGAVADCEYHDNFFILEDPHLRPFEATTSSDLRGRLRSRPQIRPPRVFEAMTSNRPVSPRFRGTSEATEAKNQKSAILLILIDLVEFRPRK